MKKIWLQKTSFTSRQSSAKLALQFLTIGFLVIGFGFFGFYYRLTNWLFSPNKIDIFNDLNQISFYFSLIDQELSNQIQTLDSILQSYLKWENVLKTKETEILQLRTYAKDHKSYLKRVWFSNYEKAFEMLNEAWPLRDEIFKLLGKDQSFNYLIPLQNLAPMDDFLVLLPLWAFLVDISHKCRLLTLIYPIISLQMLV